MHFGDEVVTKARRADNGLWYACLDDGPHRHPGDPDYPGCGATREEAVARSAASIRQGMAEGRGNLSGIWLYLLMGHWATKQEREVGHDA